jgi:hypothetical protein
MAQPTAPVSAVARGLALVLLAAVFLRAGTAPIAHIDSWADWKFGQRVWERGWPPERDALSPYDEPNVKVHDASWLAEVTYYLVSARAGLEGVSLLYALLETARAALFLFAVRRATGSLLTAVVATALMEAACWPFCDAVRTQAPAEVCWAALLLACSGRVPSRADVIAAPAVVALWANLSSAFVVGLLLLAALLVGRFLQESRAHRGLTKAAQEPAVIRLALMLALAVGAACVNPYGTALLREATAPDPVPVLPVRLWPTLVPVHLWESRVLIASVLVVLVTLRLSPRPFTPGEVLLTASFALWAWYYDKRLAPWWLTLAPWLLAPHWQAIVGQVAQPAKPEPVGQPALRWPLALGAAGAAVLVLLSPAARWARGHPRPPEQRVGPMTPYYLAAQLRERQAPPLRVFTLPYWWGDYLLWRLPADDCVFWYSRPAGTVRKQGDVPTGLNPAPAEWRALVEHYRLNALAVRAESAEGLRAYLAERPPGEWEVIADNKDEDAPGGGPDSRGLVVVRRTDPFVLSLAQAGAARACVGDLGLSPAVGLWSVPTHLPWTWPPSREQGSDTRPR